MDCLQVLSQLKRIIWKRIAEDENAAAEKEQCLSEGRSQKDHVFVEQKSTQLPGEGQNRIKGLQHCSMGNREYNKTNESTLRDVLLI